MNEQEVKTLIDKYNRGLASAEEKAWMDHWYASEAARQNFPEAAIPDEATKARLWQRTLRRAGLTGQPPLIRRLWPRIAAAAAILIFMTTGGYFLLHKKAVPQQMAQNQPDLAPGGSTAILTLGNGQKIQLTAKQQGRIARQAGIPVMVTGNGQVSYTAGQVEASQELVYNTLTTPKASQRSMTLSDGTGVILDAGSSITFPVVFSGKARNVSITGQVFFSVKHKAEQPFFVHVKGQTIEDIGTTFNVNAYDDEAAVKTTLIAGSVWVSAAGGQGVPLIPGQQAIFRDNQLTVGSANTDGAIAWTRGFFYFDHADLKTAMRQFARWYDVDIAYEGQLPETQFTGKISRNVKASEVFEALQHYHVSFKIEGRKVIVTGQ